MKTLKKTLSLTLVFALVFSLMSMAFAAETTTTSTTTTGYKDAADITYKEAVDVTSAIGVFQGNDLGAFAPKDNLTREQAAKIICYLSMGQAAADKLTTSSAPFADVAADRWSAGSIAYCVQQGIVAGYGNGKFGPTDTVTGYQFAKMLLVALSYDPSIEGFTGNDWQINVAKRAFANKLFAGNDAFVGTNPATREEAALYVLNTLQAYEVSYANKGTNITLPDGTTVNTGATPAASTGYKFMATHYSKLSVTDTADDAGRSIRVWKNGVTAIGSYASTAAVASWTAEHKGSDNTVNRALAGYTFPANGTVVYTDGVAAAAATASVDTIKGLTGNGVLVEVFANEKNEIYRVAVTTQKLATIINKDTVNKTVTVNDGTYQVTLSEKSDITAYGNAYTALYAKNVGDKVLLSDRADATNGITAIFSYADPTVVAGQYTAQSVANGTWTIGGKAYEANKTYNPSFVLGSTVSVYLDSYGYMIGLNTSATTTTYAFALALSRDGSAMAGYTYNAKLLFGDGSVKWVKIAAYNGSTNETQLNAYVSTAANANQFVGYTAQADGSFALSAVTPATVTSSADAAITKDTSSLNLGGGVKIVTNSTMFLIYNNSTKTYDAYKGIKNVPTTAVASGKAFGLLDSTSKVYGMVVVNEGATSAADSVYIYDNTAIGSAFVNGVQIDTYKAIVNGVIGTVNVKHFQADGSTPVSVSVGLTTNNTYSNGVLVAFGAAPGTTVPATFTKAADANKAYCNATVAADKITLIGGVLSDTASTGIVGDNFVCYVVDSATKTVTVQSLGSTPKNTAGALNFVIDANGYVAYAILVK